MSDVATAILDAAEKRIRVGGFNGFSFREIAADVGIKSSSVHYHFYTKEELTAAVVRRYTEWASNFIDEALLVEPDPVKAWTKAFRGTIVAGTMCPCIVMGAASQDLPPSVAAEVRRFFEMHAKKMADAGLDPESASELLATITGASVLANVFSGTEEYDRATRDLLPEALAA
jgi:TetR/AcrR family transcriptional repressor of nem operon